MIKYHGKDNALLVEFDFIIDMDYAMVKYIMKHKPHLIKPEYANLSDLDLRFALLYRPTLNPLFILNQDYNLDNEYSELLDPSIQNELIKNYSRPYDTFSLMLTYLEEASSVYITVLCNHDFEAEHVSKLNSNLNVIVDKRSDILALDYSSIMLHSFFNVLGYGHIEGKHLFIANTRYNMDEEHNDVPNLKLASCYNVLWGNMIHCMDVYRDIKYRPLLYDHFKEDANENKN